MAPLRAGSGLKVKLLDLFAHGLAVAATPAAVAGFSADTQALLVADDAAGLAAAIVRALGEPAEGREAAALAMAGRYEASAVFRELAAALSA